MEKQGVLRKTKDHERKNMVRITLTDKGEEALRPAMETETMGISSTPAVITNFARSSKSHISKN